MFPTDRVDETPMSVEQVEDEERAISEKLRVVLSNLATRKSVADNGASEKVPRPGSSYKRYRSESNLDEKSKVFYQAAAKTAGVSLKSLVLAVYRTERKVQQPMARGSGLQTVEEHSENEVDGITDNAGNVDETMDES